MHQASILMTAFVMMMGGTWYGLETGMLGPHTPDQASAAIEAAADSIVASPEVVQLVAKGALDQID
jgi:hypothetical protein